VRSTMMDVPLTVTGIMQYGTRLYGGREVVTCTGDGTRRQTYAYTGARAARLANALRALGVDGDQRVATLMWNNAEHLEAYLAIPSMGAVLHTLNLRLDPGQLAYIANHAADDVIVCNDTLIPLLAQLLPQAETVRHVVVTGPAEALAAHAEKLARPGVQIHSYEELLAAAAEAFDWPDLDERSAAAMCYTSGTTGMPKGVVYSHRSAYLHSMGVCMGNSLGMSEQDRVLPVVPMFHANAWGLPYAAIMSGADLVMPDRFLQPEPLARFIEAERPTVAGAVPTIWNGLLQHVRAHGGDLSSLRMVPCGGSAVPRSLMEAFEKELGVRIVQAWGMTETSPIGSVAHPPAGIPADEAWRYRDTAGRLVCAVEAKDVIKSGGEWISSMELENAIMAHPDVMEAAVIGVPDEKWGERPLAAVVLRDGASVTPAELRDFLVGRLPRWQLPERWSFIAEVPKTSVGKFAKTRMREAYAHGDYQVVDAC